MWVLCLAPCGDRSAILFTTPSEPPGPVVSISNEPAQTVEKYVVGDVVYIPADTPGEATAVAVADLNQDGHLDLVLARDPELSLEKAMAGYNHLVERTPASSQMIWRLRI